MDKKVKSPELHLFICTACRSDSERNEDKEPQIAAKMRKNIKEIAKNKWEKTKLRVNSAGCLGHCSKGINAVCYPEGTWFHSLSKDCEKKLLNFLEEKLD